jgi:hypothetical protein
VRDASDENIKTEIARTGLPKPLYWRRISPDEIPQDRTYRNAWRMSRNGGPIRIDSEKALAIDEQRMWLRYEGARLTVRKSSVGNGNADKAA